MTWEEIANERMKEINRLRALVRQQTNIIEATEMAAKTEQNTLTRMYDEQGRTDTADYAVNYCIDHILWALDPQTTRNQHTYCPCQNQEDPQ